jgi:hypothetical protein
LPPPPPPLPCTALHSPASCRVKLNALILYDPLQVSRLTRSFTCHLFSQPTSQPLPPPPPLPPLPQREQHRLACAALFKFPNASAKWCPRNLTDISLTAAYYNQVQRARVETQAIAHPALCSSTSTLHSAGAAQLTPHVPPPLTPQRRGYALPNAIYTDAIGDTGTLLTSAVGWAQGDGNKVRRRVALLHHTAALQAEHPHCSPRSTRTPPRCCSARCSSFAAVAALTPASPPSIG